MTTLTKANMTQARRRFRRVTEEAKCLNTYPGINWAHFAWDITGTEHPRPHRKRRLMLYFSARRESPGAAHIPYEQSYADFAKALVRTRASERGVSHSGQTHTMIALRYLYDALKQTGTTDPIKLTRKHFKNAVAGARSRARGWTLYHVGKALEQISTWMDERELTPRRIGFKNPVLYPGLGDGLDPDSQAKGLLKMPSATALDALADISNNPLNDNERILLRIVDLLVVGGFRIGEVLTLPADCWVETPALDDNGKIKTDPTTGEKLIRTGLRYWPEKGGDPYVKWLSDITIPLARRAVEDLKELCSEARVAAKVLEENPDRVPLPLIISEDAHIDLKEVARVFGLRSVQSARKLLVESLELKPAATSNASGRYAFQFRVVDIEKSLLKRRRDLVIVRRPGGNVQPLSQSLCVMFQYQFHARHPTYKFLPEIIGEGQINDALGNDADEVSVFSVRGLKEPDGSPMRIKTNAFRHWLNTLLARGGLSDVELARWSGRRNIDQNAAYKHGTVAQRVAWAHEMIKLGELHGPAADTYHSIADPVEKEVFLKTFVSVALFTPYGVCTHDYAIDPCPYHLNCLAGCPEYLRRKGNREEQENITAVLNFHLVQLQRSNKTHEEEAGGAGNYAIHCQRIIAGARAALAVDDGDIHNDALAQVFPGGKLLGRPVR